VTLQALAAQTHPAGADYGTPMIIASEAGLLSIRCPAFLLDLLRGVTELLDPALVVCSSHTTGESLLWQTHPVQAVVPKLPLTHPPG
jgi:hypothetical protein